MTRRSVSCCDAIPAPASAGGSTARQRDHLIDRYLLPQPRNAMAEALRRHASAAMDVSDGLAGDLRQAVRAHQASAADIEVARVPLSAAARAGDRGRPALIETALTGGDDYEIVATVPAPAKSRR